VCGNLTTSPSYQEVLNTILQVANENGVLAVVQNYTDVLNFELAKDIAISRGLYC